MMFSIFRIHSYCVPVFFCVHFHCFGRCREAKNPCFLRALDCWTAGCWTAGCWTAGCWTAGMHAHSAGTRQGAVRIPTVLQHCLRAFQLLPSTLCSISNSVFWAVRTVLERSRNACTQCWNQAGSCAHPYCTPALLACIPTTFPSMGTAWDCFWAAGLQANTVRG